MSKIQRISSISLFGSAAKGTMNEESDIDFLVQFSDDRHLFDNADNYFSNSKKKKNTIFAQLIAHVVKLVYMPA